MYKYGHSIVACARWEAEDIVEWVEYHRNIGFEHFYIYCNDDSPNQLFKVLMPYIFGNNPLVTFVYWKDIGAQSEMYAHFLRNYKSETKWAIFLDVDEFVTLRQHETITEFLGAFPADVDCIYFNWLNWGNNGKPERDGKSILSTLTRRARHVDVQTKMLWRTQKVTEALALEGAARTRNAYTHFWNGYNFEKFVMRDVLNRSVADYATDWPNQAHQAIKDQEVSDAMIDMAHISHFVIKSEKDFIRRAERGGFAAQVMWREKFESGEYVDILARFNEVEDFHLARKWHNMTMGRLINGARDDRPDPLG